VVFIIFSAIFGAILGLQKVKIVLPSRAQNKKALIHKELQGFLLLLLKLYYNNSPLVTLEFKMIWN